MPTTRKAKQRNLKAEVYPDWFKQKMNEVTTQTLAFQADSLSAIDSKAQTYVSIIAILLAILLGFLAINFDGIPARLIIPIKLTSGMLLFLFLVDIELFFDSIKSSAFKTGVKPEGLNDMHAQTETEVKEEIFSNLYWSTIENTEICSKKAMKLRKAEKLLRINTILTFALGIILIACL